MKNKTREKNRCPNCGQVIDKREITLFSGLVVALWKIYRICKEKEKHEFTMKEVKYLLGQNEYARFGDWVLFGGLVYKHSKGNYGLNMERCKQFFNRELQIPTRLWKDPMGGELEKLDYKFVSEIPGLIKFLDNDLMYQANYKPRSQNKLI